VKFLPLYIRLVNAILQLVARYLIFRTTFNDRLISSCRLVESTTSMLSRRVTVKSLDLIQSLVECCSRLQKLSVSDLVLLLDRTSLLAIFGRLVVGSGRRRVATGSAAGWLTGGISSTPGCAVHRGTPRSPRRPTDRRLAIDRPSRDTSQSVSQQTDRRRHSAVPPRRMSSAPAR